MWWRIDPRKSPEHAARRAALKAEYETRHGPGRKTHLRFEDGGWIAAHRHHPCTDDPASQEFAKLCAMTPCVSIADRVTPFFEDGKLFIDFRGTRYIVPDVPLLTATLIRHIANQIED